MFDPDKYKSTRLAPTQLRGKERVRIILAASLSLFKERGIEEVTTNEIALRAKIPIGSLYRYYPNKDAIIVVLTNLYVEDLSALFAETANHPLFPMLSWQEIVFMTIDPWVHYSRMSGSFAFLYAERANPRLRALNREGAELFKKNFFAVFTKRCAKLTIAQLTVVMQFAIAASELGINDTYAQEVASDLHHEAITAIAGYLDNICQAHNHTQVS